MAEQDTDRLKAQLHPLRFFITLACEVQVNGLGQIVTYHVQEGQLKGHPDLTEQEGQELSENVDALSLLMLSQALANAQANVREKMIHEEEMRKADDAVREEMAALLKPDAS